MLKKILKTTLTFGMSVLLVVSATACQPDKGSGDAADTQPAGNVTNVQTTENAAQKNDNENSGNTNSVNAITRAKEPVTEHKHTYQETIVDGNCVTYPKTIYKCSECGNTYEKINEEAGYGRHQYTEKRVSATCTEPAKTIYTCSICGDSYSVDDENEPALGHNYISHSVVVEATNNSPGIKRFACDRCGEYNESDYALPQTVNTKSGIKIVYGYWDKACEKEIADILNAYREANGLKSFKTYASLSETAHERALEIAFSYRHNHSRPDNSSWRTAYRDNLTACGENIASGQENAQAVMDAWENSSSHNENMLSNMFDSVGIGVFVRVDCEESGEVTEPDPDGRSYHTRYYVQSFSD